MDEQQQQRVNQAAEEFANALKESYQTMASRGESNYDMNAQLTEQFFNRVINNLQSQAQANRQTGEQLAEQAQRGQEASRELTQESVQAYMERLVPTSLASQGYTFASFFYSVPARAWASFFAASPSFSPGFKAAADGGRHRGPWCIGARLLTTRIPYPGPFSFC